MEWKASSCDIAVLGMAVMGKNLALNFADHGAQVAIYNRTTARAQDAAIQHPEQHLMLSETLPQLVASLKRPRCLLMMVKAGEAVDMLIEQLIPLLEPGDILMDGGNSYFKDTARREASVQS